VIDARLALAFSAGMLATVNPCGFAMLPAYLSYFIGAGEAERRMRPGANVARALAVGASVSAGFMVLFAVAGMLLSWLSVEKGGRSRTLGSMFLFGVSYGIASLGCTLPVFLATVSGTFQRSNVISGVAVYAMYALGMALVLMALTVAISLARQSLVRGLKRALPYVSRIAGVLVVTAGAYVAWYGVVELRTQHGKAVSSRAVDTVTGWSGSISTWVDHVGATRLGLVLGLVVAIAALVGLLRADPR